MGIGAAEPVRKIGKAGELMRAEDAVRNAQPAHIAVLRRRDIEQAEIAPAEIVLGFRELLGVALRLRRA